MWGEKHRLTARHDKDKSLPYPLQGRTAIRPQRLVCRACPDIIDPKPCPSERIPRPIIAQSGQARVPQASMGTLPMCHAHYVNRLLPHVAVCCKSSLIALRLVPYVLLALGQQETTMKFSVTLLLGAAAVLVSAQEVSDIPPCALACFVSNIQSETNCGITDNACQCEAATQEILRPKITPCVQQACSSIADQLSMSCAVKSISCLSLHGTD